MRGCPEGPEQVNKNSLSLSFSEEHFAFYLDSRQEPLLLRFRLSLALCFYPKGLLAMLASEVRGYSMLPWELRTRCKIRPQPFAYCLA